jgi:hypothetical protein
MHLLKSFLLVILVIVIGLAGFQVALNRGLIKNEALAAFNEKYLAKSMASATSQFSQVSSRLGIASQEGGAVLGAVVQVNEEEKKPIHDKAFEYGRYLYCQQVIKDYDASQNKSAASPNP